MKFPSLHRAGPTVALTSLTLGLVGTALLFASIASGCRRNPSATAPNSAPAATKLANAGAAAPAHRSFPSSECKSCHEDVFAAWSASHHAHAHRVVDAAADADAFATPRRVTVNGVRYDLQWKGDRPEISETRPGETAEPYRADFVLGYTPLRQYIVPIGGGRYQAADLAFDPAKKDWFNVFGDEQRRPGEWGHWRGRGMNWNSMCAHCHITDFAKNYDATNDTYASTWREHGVGCAQCHSDLPANHAELAKARPANAPRTSSGATAADLKRAQETCAPCHARNELLTGQLHAGAAYNDHFRLTLPTEAAVFYPDGQMRDEDFNYTSFLTSRMGGKAGVTCLDCHDAHSGRTKLPAANNAICLQCHGPSPRNNAPVIDPLAHSHHGADSTGNQCVSCHMPTTTYMQRDPRHDHGFTKPDPLLTKELGIPNACSRCHTDKDVDWATTHADQWYGAKLDSRQRARARAVASAQSNAPDAVDKLLTLLANEEVPAWRATLLLLSRPFLADARVLPAARTATRDADPLVRSAAAQVLAAVPSEAATLRPLLEDPSRLVRLDAAWPLSPTLPAESAVRRELDAYLAVSADQPAGRMRLGQDLFNRGRATEAEAALRKAAEWDPNSPGIQDALGLVLNEVGKPAEAAAALWRAARLNPNEANSAFNAALAFAGAGKLPDAEIALKETVRRDSRHHRAWYNLGLLLAQTSRPAEALNALQRAEQVAPNVADYPYARATVLWQTGDRAGAAAAVRRALEIDPSHGPSRAFLQQAR